MSKKKPGRKAIGALHQIVPISFDVEVLKIIDKIGKATGLTRTEVISGLILDRLKELKRKVTELSKSMAEVKKIE